MASRALGQVEKPTRKRRSVARCSLSAGHALPTPAEAPAGRGGVLRVSAEHQPPPAGELGIVGATFCLKRNLVKQFAAYGRVGIGSGHVFQS